MATASQIECEDWVRLEWLPKQFGQAFYRERLRLESGGVLDFDAVSADRTTAVRVFTRAARNAAGKFRSARLARLRSDMLLLTMSGASRRILVLTDRDAYDLCARERAAGRVPPGIEFLHVGLPDDLVQRLIASRGAARAEVAPRRAPAATTPTSPPAAADPARDDRDAPRPARANPRRDEPAFRFAEALSPPASWLSEDSDGTTPWDGA